MKHTKLVGSLLLMTLVGFFLAGCSTATKVSISGSPNLAFTGHYRGTHVDSDIKGTGEMRLDIGRQTLHEIEIQKLAIDQTAHLEIRQGHKVVVEATAEPGVRGLRVRNSDGWKIERVQ